MLDKIQSFYGFTRMPYGRNLAPSMLHPHADHTQAAARIAYGIDTHGITVITGEVGVGKTVAARAALDRVDRACHHLIYIPDPTVGARGVFHHIVTALGARPSFHTAALIPQARDALATELSERGRTPVLLIDEAHLLGHDGLEAVRLLTLCRPHGYADPEPETVGRNGHRPRAVGIISPIWINDPAPGQAARRPRLARLDAASVGAPRHRGPPPLTTGRRLTPDWRLTLIWKHKIMPAKTRKPCPFTWGSANRVGITMRSA